VCRRKNNKLIKKMMNKKIGLTVLGLAVLGFVAYSSNVFAANNQRQGGFGPNYTPERHEKMLKAFENKDYNAWKSLMGDRGAAKIVTEQNFDRFTQMHNLMLEGKNEEANAIRQELGLGSGQGNGQGRGMMGKGNGQGGQRGFVDANGDGKCDNMR
jgi:hypothetical protein